MLAYINDEVIKSANWWLMVANMHVRCMPFWSTSHGQRFRASMLQHPDNAYLLERPPPCAKLRKHLGQHAHRLKRPEELCTHGSFQGIFHAIHGTPHFGGQPAQRVCLRSFQRRCQHIQRPFHRL